MRLLFIPSWFPSKDDPFAGSFIKQLSVDLAAEGIEIVVMHFAYSYKSTTVELIKEQINDRLTVYHFNGFQLPKVNNLLQTRWVKRCFEAFSKNYEGGAFDLIHSHDYVASFVGDYFKEKMNIPHVCTLHHSDFLENKIPQWRVKLLKKILLDCRKVFVPSSALKIEIDNSYNVNCKLIPHYIIESSKAKDKLPEVPERGIVVTSNEKVKNNKGLIYYCKMNSIKVDIYGDIEKDLLKEMDESVRFCGKVRHAVLLDKYSDYDFYLSYSSVETFGLAGLEALTAGLPVLIKNKLGSKDYVFADTGVFIEGEESFRVFVERYKMYSSEKIREKIGKRFSKIEAMKRYLELYDSLK